MIPEIQLSAMVKRYIAQLDGPVNVNGQTLNLIGEPSHVVLHRIQKAHGEHQTRAEIDRQMGRAV